MKTKLLFVMFFLFLTSLIIGQNKVSTPYIAVPGPASSAGFNRNIDSLRNGINNMVDTLKANYVTWDKVPDSLFRKIRVDSIINSPYIDTITSDTAFVRGFKATQSIIGNARITGLSTTNDTITNARITNLTSLSTASTQGISNTGTIATDVLNATQGTFTGSKSTNDTVNRLYLGNATASDGFNSETDKLVAKGTFVFVTDSNYTWNGGLAIMTSKNDAPHIYNGALTIRSNTPMRNNSGIGITMSPKGSAYSGYSKIMSVLADSTIETWQNTDISFWTRSGYSNIVTDSEKMRLKHSGNLGIGTATPTHKLQVNGTFKASSTTTTNDTVTNSRITNLTTINTATTAGINNTGTIATDILNATQGTFTGSKSTNDTVTNARITNLTTTSTTTTNGISNTGTVTTDSLKVNNGILTTRIKTDSTHSVNSIKTSRTYCDSLKVGNEWFSYKTGSIPCTVKTSDFTTMRYGTMAYSKFGKIVTLNLRSSMGGTTTSSGLIRLYANYNSITGGSDIGPFTFSIPKVIINTTSLPGIATAGSDNSYIIIGLSDGSGFTEGTPVQVDLFTITFVLAD